MRHILLLMVVFVLASCASPTFQMSAEQVASLSDDQLCEYHNGYRAEAKAELEISRRGLNCDPYFRRCLSKGNRPGTEAMAFCIDTLEENEQLRRESYFDHLDIYGYHDYDHLRSVHH